MPTSAGKQPEERDMSFKALDELLPGIPNEITSHHIVPKLPWRAFHALSAVSRAWRYAIRTRQVHDWRIHSPSLETLVLLVYRSSTKLGWDFHDGIAVYSTRDESWSELPLLADVVKRVPSSFECVALDGKVYLLGGELVRKNCVRESSPETFVFDIAGQNGWKQCASMKNPRLYFGCGVMNGKIYIFGGMSGYQPVFGSEVYDPTENVWSSIRPMLTLRSHHHVEVVGDEFYVYSGRAWIADEQTHWTTGENCVEIYNPLKDKWRMVKPFGFQGFEGYHTDSRLFTARGKLHSMSWRGIHVHDAEADSWTHLHSLNPEQVPLSLDPWHDELISLASVLAVDAELFALVIDEEHKCCFIIRSRDLGSANKCFLWKRAELSTSSFSASSEVWPNSYRILRTIQL